MSDLHVCMYVRACVRVYMPGHTTLSLVIVCLLMSLSIDTVFTFSHFPKHLLTNCSDSLTTHMVEHLFDITCVHTQEGKPTHSQTYIHMHALTTQYIGGLVQPTP